MAGMPQAMCVVYDFPPGLERVTDPRPQISLWPNPKGSISLADHRAIKVRACHIDFSTRL